MQIIFCALVLSACLHRLTLGANNSLTERKLERRKRYLAFPKGSSLQLVYCFLVAALGSQNIFTVGITLGLAWEIPPNLHSNLASKPQQNLRRRDGRSLYPKLELFLHKLGIDGRACIMRAICEAMYRNTSTVPFIEEIFHSVFTYPEGDNNDADTEQSSIYDQPRHNNSACVNHFRSCPTSLLDHNFIS